MSHKLATGETLEWVEGMSPPLSLSHNLTLRPRPLPHAPSMPDSIQLLCSLYRTVNDSLFFHVFYCQLYSMKVFIYFLIDRLQFIWFTFDCFVIHIQYQYYLFSLLKEL